jgi:hypothetical protein
MSLVDLANTKVRVLGWSAVMGVAPMIASAIANPGVTAALGVMANPTVGGISILATIAGGIAGNMAANDLGNLMAEKLAKNPNILDNRDLIEAAGEAIADILKDVAKSDELIAIAETKNLTYPKQALERLAEKTPEYWLNINTEGVDLSRGLNISEDQLTLIFSADAAEFDRVTGLTPEDWARFLGEFAASEGKSFDAEIVEFVAQRLYETFPKRYREVLIQDAAKGGEKFAAMLLNLHQIALAQLKDLGLQNGEILGKLEAVATRQQICQVMAKLGSIEIGIRSDLAEIRALLQRYIDPAAPSLPISLKSETIIQDRIKDFTGRKFVFEAINEFLRTNRKGYFVLEAEPGVGKSAIMAACVVMLKRRCVTHFNSQPDGIVSAKTFLENACIQLIEGFNLKDKYPRLPENALENGNFLGRLLGEVSAKLGGKKLIFVVDALDEVDLKEQTRGSNVLYLPNDLPDNVYFIVSKRPELLRMPENDNYVLFDLMQHSAESVEDVKAYIHNFAKNSAGIDNWIQPQNLSLEQFVRVLAERSKNNFMYLRYVLKEINSGTYRDVNLNDLPAGLEKYYYKHLDRMDVKDKESRRRKLKVIYVLSRTRKPVSCELLANFAKEDELDVQDVLDGWEGFVRPSSENPPKYSIYHASFQRFLHSQEAVKKAGLSLSDIDDDLENDMWGDLYGDG